MQVYLGATQKALCPDLQSEEPGRHKSIRSSPVTNRSREARHPCGLRSLRPLLGLCRLWLVFTGLSGIYLCPPPFQAKMGPVGQTLLT